jgi:hypothetical protein
MELGRKDQIENVGPSHFLLGNCPPAKRKEVSGRDAFRALSQA